MKAARFVVYRFAAGQPAQPWVPLMPEDTPAWLKEPDPMGDMAQGAILEHEGNYYKAVKLEDSPIVVA